MAEQPTTSTRVTRRGVVSGVVVGATATGLTACGSDDSGGGSTGGGSGGTGQSPAAPLTVPTSEVPVGGGFVDEKTKVVVTQPKEGTFKAFSAVCTHEGCVVDAVKDNVIECPCHASKFDGDTGEVTDGPAESALPAKKATVKGDQVTIA